MSRPRIGPMMRQALTRTALLAAWEKVADNGGMPGTDGETINELKPDIHRVLVRLAKEVVAGHYQPEPLKRVWIPRPGRTPRALAVPSVRDRILQTSVAQTITPRVEAELEDCSFAYRQGRGVRQAVERIEYYQRQGYRWVVDADIENFFDNIPHAALLTRLEQIVPEEALIELLAQWLTAEIEDRGTRTRPAKGTPQGSPISPLLANLYLDTLDDALLDANHILVRYADDFVVLAKSQARAEDALELTREVLDRISLRLNPIKTRIVHLDQGMEFLGWQFIRSLALPKSWREESLSDTVFNPPEVQEEADSAMAEALKEALAEKPAWTPVEKRITPKPPEERPDHPPVPKTVESPPINATQTTLTAEITPIIDLEVPEEDTENEVNTELPPLAPLQRTLYLVDRQAALSVDNQRYQVTRAGEVVLSLPATHVDNILVFGQVPVSNGTLQLASKHQCPISFLSWFGRCYGRFEAPGQGTYSLLAAQVTHQTGEFPLAIARALISAKIHNSALVLKRSQRHWKNSLDHEGVVRRLKELANTLKSATSIDSLRGTEGAAAALYWKAFAELLPGGWHMPRRQAHPAPDPVNALLSLGYTILYHSVAGLIQARGLYAGLGHLHAVGGDHHALASDLMESYRAYVVDAALLRLLHTGQLDHNDHRQQQGRCMLGSGTTRHFIRALENRFNTVQQHPQDNEAMDFRRVIDRDVLCYISALRKGDSSLFAATRWR